MDRVKGLPLPLPIHSADLMDKALSTLQKCGFNADMALKEIARVRKQDFELRDWTAKETGAFEEGIRLYGHELSAIKRKVETRSMRDVVRFFYQWKKTERYQPVYSVFTKIHKPKYDPRNCLLACFLPCCEFFKGVIADHSPTLLCGRKLVNTAKSSSPLDVDQ